MHTEVIRPKGINIGNRRLIEAKMKGVPGYRLDSGLQEKEKCNFHEFYT